MVKDDQADGPEILTIEEIAKRLDVSDRTIRNWLTEKDMPSIKDLRGRRFVWLDVLIWFVNMRVEEAGNGGKPPAGDGQGETFATQIERANLRRFSADAELKELELAERRGQVVAVADAAQTLADTAKALQVEILAWPTVMVGRIFGIQDRGQLLALLTSSARDLCSRLAGLGAAPDA